MELLHSLPPQTFLGLEQDFSKAKFVLIPIPFDSTVCFKPGARDAPREIIEASRYFEEYDAETNWLAPQCFVFTTRELEPCRGDARETLNRVKQVVGDVLDSKKIPFLLGGEHSISIGAMEALVEREKKFSVLSIDAHADLLDAHEGSRYAHGCVMRRAFDLGARITEAGVRSYSIEEKKFIEANKNRIKIFSAKEIHSNPAKALKKIVSSLDENIYLSIDVDALEPSLMPATGCPEPNGLSWSEAMALLENVCSKKKVLGLDLVEFSPIAGMHAPSVVAAKMALKAIAFISLNKRI